MKELSLKPGRKESVNVVPLDQHEPKCETKNTNAIKYQTSDASIINEEL